MTIQISGSEEFYFGDPYLTTYHPMSGTHLCLVSDSLSGTPSLVCNPTLSRIPSTVWNFIPCLVSYPSVHTTTILPPPYLAPNCPTPDLTPGYPHLELLSPATLLLSHYPPATAIWPSFSLPCHLVLLTSTVPAPICLLTIPSCPTTPAIWPSCLHHPPPYLVLLPLPLTHRISSPKSLLPKKGNLSFSKFLSFLMFISISPHVGSISPCVLSYMQIYYFSPCTEKFLK